MNPDEEKVRELIACQAGEWVAAHQASGLDAAERRAFYAWLIASPIHVEEYLEVALLSRRLSITRSGRNPAHAGDGPAAGPPVAELLCSSSSTVSNEERHPALKAGMRSARSSPLLSRPGK